jgi:hypothetical protein
MDECKIYIYSYLYDAGNDGSRTKIYTPNLKYIRNLGYTCLSDRKCPNIMQYLKTNNIEKCKCIIHIVSNDSIKYLMRNVNFLMSKNNVKFVRIGDVHRNMNKKNSYRSMRKLTDEIYQNAKNLYVYTAAINCIHKHIPKTKSLNLIDCPNSVNDDMLVGFNNNPINGVLLSGSCTKEYPARKHMIKLSKKENRIFRLKYSYGKHGLNYTKHINRYICAFTCCLNSDIQYLVGKFFEIPSTGALLLAFDLYVKDFMKKLGFIDNVNYISCDIKNMDSKIKYILDPENRETIDKIRKNGQKLVISKHKKSDRIKFLDDLIESIKIET